MRAQGVKETKSEFRLHEGLVPSLKIRRISSSRALEVDVQVPQRESEHGDARRRGWLVSEACTRTSVKTP